MFEKDHLVVAMEFNIVDSKFITRTCENKLHATVVPESLKRRHVCTLFCKVQLLSWHTDLHALDRDVLVTQHLLRKVGPGIRIICLHSDAYKYSFVQELTAIAGFPSRCSGEMSEQIWAR
jgi:hypothetical protein